MNFAPSEKRLMQLLYLEGPLSRKSLALKLSLTGAAVTLSTQSLLSENLLEEAGSLPTHRAGRREERVALHLAGATLAGVDVRKRFYYVTLTNLGGSLLESAKFASVEEAVAYLKKKAQVLPPYLGIGVTIRGFSSLASLAKEHPGLIEAFRSFSCPVHFLNNVESLAYLYQLYHPEDSNFLLLKYGPGVGSSVFVGGHPLKGQDGSSSEIGHWFIYSGHKLEDEISFETLLGGEYDEKEGAEALMKNPKALERCIDTLGFSLINANYLLSLDKIVVSGVLLSDPQVFDRLAKRLVAIDASFDTKKLVVYDQYEGLNERKGSLQVFADNFLL
jgi:transcriptional regulator of PTS gene